MGYRARELVLSLDKLDWGAQGNASSTSCLAPRASALQSTASAWRARSRRAQPAAALPRTVERRVRWRSYWPHRQALLTSVRVCTFRTNAAIIHEGAPSEGGAEITMHLVLSSCLGGVIF